MRKQPLHLLKKAVCRFNITKHDYLVLLAGILFSFAFAPFHLTFMAFLSPAVLLFAWCSVGSKPLLAARYGFLFGFGFFAVGVSWVYISIHTFGQASPILAFLVTFLFITYLSLFFAAQGFCLVTFSPKNDFFKCGLAFPSSWFLFEYLRSSLFTGFPWLLWGYTQTSSYLNGFSPVVGVYGLSIIGAFISAILVLMYKKRMMKVRIKLIAMVSLLFFASFWLQNIQWTTKQGNTIKATLIQGNIDQALKWDSSQLLKTLALYLKHTEENWSSDIIIWPEAAIPLPLNQAQDFLKPLSSKAYQHQSVIITGIPVISPQAAFNSIVLLGDAQGVYHKRHLVPFGEYTPLKSFFAWMLKSFHIPMSNFMRGSESQQPLIAKNIKIAPSICYEIAYPLEVLAFLPKAELLVTLTDDSWFGHSSAQAQHLQIAQMRAQETGRFLLFSGNTGLTAIITPKGEIANELAPFEEKTLTAEVTPMTGTTPWMVWRLYPEVGFLLMTLLIGLLIRQKENVTVQHNVKNGKNVQI